MIKIYRASAGSGKTYQLAKEYIHLLFDSKNERMYRRILAVTFTNKATDEMKTRILNELHLLSIAEKSDYRAGLMLEHNATEEEINSRARKILTTLLHDYSSFSISTIDRFFQQIIRSFAREIGVHGGYGLELDIESTLQQSVDNLFLDLSKEENKQLLNWLTQFAEERIEQSENWNPRKNIEDLGNEIFKESYQDNAEETNRKLHDREFLKNYGHKLRKIQTDLENKLKSEAQDALKILDDNNLTVESFKGGTNSAMKTLNKLTKANFELKDTFLNMAHDVSNCYAKSTPRETVDAIQKAYSEGLQSKLNSIIQYINDNIIFYNSAGLILKNLNTLGILSDLAMQIKKLTEEQNSMLISDSNKLLNRIIDNSETPFIYEKTGINIDHFMIDEFQDTSVLQWRNFLPLISNSMSSGKLNLVVGDVKQSIYRWRNSDWKLLDEQIFNDFKSGQIDVKNLETNWRSDKNIVEFNNSFFTTASGLLQEKLNSGLLPVLKVYSDLEPLSQSITHAYAQTKQQLSPNAGNGYVNVSFIPQKENEDGWIAESLSRLPALLEEIQDRNYRPNEVCILVKRNSDAQKVIQSLLLYKSSDKAKPNYSYDIMGNDGLLLNSASSVRFVLGILRLMVNPADSIQKTIVNFEYARACLGLSENEALNQCFSGSDNGHVFSALFSEEQNRAVKTFKNSSLYEMVEQIVSLFNVGNWYNEAIYIQAFQDIVLNFTTSKTGDLYGFLSWWDKSGYKKSVSTPDNSQAFRIMTIHKSKGLEFKVVIMPICDWELDDKSAFLKNILWCVPHVEPFNELALLPVEYSSGMAKSIFAKYYFEEQMHQYTDHLNVAYVAFTRAEHELYCFAPLPTKTPENVEKIKSLSDLLYFIFQDTSNQSFGGNFDIDTQQLSIGEKSENHFRKEEPTGITEKISCYSSVNSTNRLRIKHKHLDFTLANQHLNDSRLSYGIVMHDLLCQIRVKSDQDNAVRQMVYSGRINEEEALKVLDRMGDFWKLPYVNDWFADDKRILTEASIISESGSIYRPDRVVISGNDAIVVDYKFGDSEITGHQQQVKKYMDLISQMGYNVSGFLCYVNLSKVTEVNI